MAEVAASGRGPRRRRPRARDPARSASARTAGSTLDLRSRVREPPRLLDRAERRAGRTPPSTPGSRPAATRSAATGSAAVGAGSSRSAAGRGRARRLAFGVTHSAAVRRRPGRRRRHRPRQRRPGPARSAGSRSASTWSTSTPAPCAPGCGPCRGSPTPRSTSTGGPASCSIGGDRAGARGRRRRRPTPSGCWSTPSGHALATLPPGGPGLIAIEGVAPVEPGSDFGPGIRGAARRSSPGCRPACAPGSFAVVAGTDGTVQLKVLPVGRRRPVPARPARPRSWPAPPPGSPTSTTPSWPP